MSSMRRLARLLGDAERPWGRAALAELQGSACAARLREERMPVSVCPEQDDHQLDIERFRIVTVTIGKIKT